MIYFFSEVKEALVLSFKIIYFVKLYAEINTWIFKTAWFFETFDTINLKFGEKIS